jgi:hypothetical protein
MSRAMMMVLGLALGAAGCGDDDNGIGTLYDARPMVDAGPQPDGAQAPDAGDDTPDAQPLPDAPMDSAGPVIEVLSPAAGTAGNYASDEIVTAAQITARCRATRNLDSAVPVDATSVQMTALAGGMSYSAQATPTSTANEYVADLDLSGFPNGALTVRCSAADTGGIANSAEIATYLDLGPRIVVLSPIEGVHYAKQFDLIFQVTPLPLAADDTTGAAVDLGAVVASIAGVALQDITHDASGVFQGTVIFDDAGFPVPLEGSTTLTITAPNERAPTAVTRTASVSFVADSTGPTISVASPDPGELVSGLVTLTATITDPAGIDPASVVATIAGTHEFALQSTGGSTYAGVFDTRELALGIVFPTIIVRAKDSVGNQSAVGFLVALDNVGPIASLDPPRLREAELDDELGLVCSELFDPVGEDAANDGMTVPQLSEIRARVEDRGNLAVADPSVFIPRAGVVAVTLYVLEDETQALIVDTTGDGVCDSINPKLVPTSVPMASNEAAAIDLVPLSPNGSANFRNPAGTDEQPDYDDTVGHPESACNAPGIIGGQDEPALCFQTPASRVTETEFGHDPVIYSIPPASFGDFVCMGYPFDSLGTNIGDGWACLAVLARDGLGNPGISPPLRLCFDHDGDQSDGCGELFSVETDGLPDCTGTYDAGTDTVDATTPCTFPYSFADDPVWQLRRIDI